MGAPLYHWSSQIKQHIHWSGQIHQHNQWDGHINQHFISFFVAMLTLSILGFLTNRKDRGGGGGIFIIFFQTWILSWMYRTRIQKHSTLPLKFKPSEIFEKLPFLVKIQQNGTFAIQTFHPTFGQPCARFSGTWALC